MTEPRRVARPAAPSPTAPPPKMSLDQAIRAGDLSRAFDNLTDLIQEISEHDDGGEMLSLGAAHTLSDAASTGFDTDVELPKAIIMEILGIARVYIAEQLGALGVSTDD